MSIETRRRSELCEEVRAAINRTSSENGSGTPDFILAEFLIQSLDAYDRAVTARDAWRGPDLATLRKRVEGVRDVCKVQASNGNWNVNEYMMGLANGLILAVHILDDAEGEPPFKTEEMRKANPVGEVVSPTVVEGGA